jgi:hypothetical protein
MIAQRFLVGSQKPEMQSPFTRQPTVSSQGGQLPPQSTPVSWPLHMPSSQVGACGGDQCMSATQQEDDAALSVPSNSGRQLSSR